MTTRIEEFPTAEPIQAKIRLAVGNVAVKLADVDAVTVRIAANAADPLSASPFASLFNLFAPNLGPQRDVDANLVAQATTVTFEDGVLTVQPTFRHFSMDIEVTAPTGSDLTVRTGSGRVVVTGEAGQAKLSTGTGDIGLETATGSVEIKTGSGNVTLGETVSEVVARSGSGDVRVFDAISGTLNLVSGSGDLTVGIHHGTRAQLDLFAASGKTRSDLDVVADKPADQDAEIHDLVVNGRTGSGNAWVTSAA
jgi:hypothetical protein